MPARVGSHPPAKWAAALHPHSAEVHLDPFLTGLLIKKVSLRRRIRLRYSLHTKPPLLI